MRPPIIGHNGLETHMKKILLLGALAAAGLFLNAEPSHAYSNGVWCAKVNIPGGQTERCQYATFEACRRSIIGESRSFCVQSQYAVPVVAVPEYRVIKRYRYYYY
jgi:hypothetical protein